MFYYHPDHLGSSSYITDVNGEVSQHIEYFAFGETFVEEHSNTGATPYKFNAKELDDETGLYYYGARYYDPKTSVWASVDPLAEKYPGWSPYAYTFNNPIRYNDPTGMEGEDPKTLYTNTSNAKGVIQNGFNAAQYGKYSNYNWFSTTPNAGGTGRAGQGATLGVSGIDVSNAHTITKAQTTAWRLDAMQELGYSSESLKTLQATNPKAYGEAMSKINGAMYSKVGAYMDEMGKGAYYLAKDGTYAVSDAIANKGVINTIRGSASAVKALNGLKVAGKVLMVVGIAVDAYEIYSSGYNPRTITGVAGGWAGAWAGAKVGGAIGTGIGVWIGGVGEVVTGPVGAIIGGVGGYFGGKAAAQTVYDKVTTKGVPIGGK